MPEVSLAAIGPGEQPVPVEAAPPDVRARELVLEHFDFVWRLFCRLGVSPSDADDAAQQVFIVAARRLSDIPLGNERTFLYGTVLRAAGTLRRDRRRRERVIAYGPADAPSTARTPHEELEHRRALLLLDSVLDTLEDDLREVFVLSEIEELSAPEVAALLDIPAGTVASRLRRARAAFATRLKRQQTQQTRPR